MPGRTTLASLVADWTGLADETAVVLHRGNRAYRTTYGALAGLAGRFAAELQRREILPGERVLLWGANSPEWIAAFFGCLLRGVLVVPLDSAGASEFAARVVANTSPRLLVGDEALLETQLDTVPRITFASFERVLPPAPLLDVCEAVQEDLPFQIVFTSGTTSEPKGIVHTHRNVLASLRPIEKEIGRYRRYERWFHPLRFLHTLPFSHVFGQFMGLWIPAILGAEVHLLETADPAKMVALSRGERISVLVAVPRVLDLLRQHLLSRFPGVGAELARSERLPAWKRWWRFRAVHRALGFKFWALICGGATLPADLEAFWNGLGLALIQGYGMTETAALVTLNHPFKIGKGTLGKALPGREVKLSPEGEILVRGDMLAAGVWQAGRFEPRTSEWLATGDLATADGDGELRFAGRQGDVIVTAAGLNVYPADLERVLLQQPGVRACAVVGCETQNGQEPVAVLLFTGDEALRRAAVMGANERLAPYQQVRHAYQWPEPTFPYTSTGKLLRRQIVAWAQAQLAGGVLVGHSNRDGLLAIVAEVTREQPQTAEETSRLTEDLHLDSLGRVQLQSILEDRLAVSLNDEQMAAVQTLGDLRRLVEGSQHGFSAPPAHGQTVAPAGQQNLVRASAAHPVARYPRWPWSAPVRWLRAAFLESVVAPLVRLLARPRVIYDAPLPADGAMLLIANHVNTYDVPLLLYALPTRRRGKVAVAMSAEVLGAMRAGKEQGNWVVNLFSRPAYWLVVAFFNVFPLPRTLGFRDSFAHAGEALDRGMSVLVFPEGRRGWTGELQPFRPGIGLLVRQSGVPVLPIALQGMGAASTERGTWFRRKGLAIHVGRPIIVDQKLSPEAVTRQLEEALRELGPG